MIGESMAELILKEQARRVKWKVRRELFLLACVGVAAGSLLYIAVFK